MTATLPQTEPEAFQPVAHDSVTGIVHDLGNYIQVAMSAVSIMRRQADIAGFQGLGTIAVHATDALERAGALVRRSIDREDTSQDEDVDVDMCLTQMAHLVRYACARRRGGFAFLGCQHGDRRRPA
jgi:hypothetical protein